MPSSAWKGYLSTTHHDDVVGVALEALPLAQGDVHFKRGGSWGEGGTVSGGIM